MVSDSGSVASPAYTIKALDASTWPAFAALVEANNGVFGGCWCIGFHPEGVARDTRVVWASSPDTDDLLGWSPSLENLPPARGIGREIERDYDVIGDLPSLRPQIAPPPTNERHWRDGNRASAVLCTLSDAKKVLRTLEGDDSYGTLGT